MNALRKQAEDILRANRASMPDGIEGLSAEAAREMLHELQVHQIELEMQNEELRRTQELLEGSRARYFDLYDLAPVGYFTVSEWGLILEANLTGARLLGVDRGALIEQQLSLFVVRDDQDLYYLRCKALRTTGAPQSFTVRLRHRDGVAFSARMDAATGRDASGAPAWHIIISDLTERGETKHAPVLTIV